MRHDEVSYLNKWIGSSARRRVVAYARGRTASIYSLGLSCIRRDGAETIPGTVKSRKARSTTQPRQQMLPQMRRKCWRHDDAFAPRRAGNKLLIGACIDSCPSLGPMLRADAVGRNYCRETMPPVGQLRRSRASGLPRQRSKLAAGSRTWTPGRPGPARPGRGAKLREIYRLGGVQLYRSFRALEGRYHKY